MYMRSLWPMTLSDPGALIRDLERMIDTVSRNAGTTDSQRGAVPPLNVSRDGERYYVRAILPGIEPENLQVSVERNKVTIAGERALPDEPSSDGGGRVAGPSFHRRERSEGSFNRTITLDTMFDPEGVSATYREGILTVALPLASAAKARMVPVRASDKRTEKSAKAR
jgi:HSP20 family protein